MDFRLIESGWDRVFEEALQADHSALRIICPFIKLRAAKRLLKAGRPTPIQVITRFDQVGFASGVSDIAALRLLLEHGAQIRGVRNLHAKLYLFGTSQVILTSANLTEAALLRNHEFGFFAGEAGIIGRCRSYFDALWDRAAGSDLTETCLEDWERRVISAQVGGLRPSMAAGLTDEGVDVGFLASPISVPPAVLEAPQAFVKFFGENQNRQAYGVSTFDEVQRTGCHRVCTYPRGKRPRQVTDGAVMFMGRLVKSPADIIIFGRAIGMPHVPGRDDATPADLALRPWKANWPHYIRVHSPEFVTGTLANGVSLFRLMAVLGSDSFTSTKRNAVMVEGNTDPRKAYMQQPAVELTPEGFAWVNEQLEFAFATHGKMTPDELARLDWPD